MSLFPAISASVRGIPAAPLKLPSSISRKVRNEIESFYYRTWGG